MRMAWPERVTLFLALVVAALVFMFGAVINGGASSAAWIGASGAIAWHLCVMIVFPFWFVMRIIAFIVPPLVR